MESPSKALKRLDLYTSNRPLDVISHWDKEGMLLLNPPYQRGDVWGPIRRSNLIRSILLGIPIPSIIVNDRMAGEWRDEYSIAVIDGKQRATTVLMFLKDQLPVPGEWFGLEGSIVRSDLSIATQRKIRNTPLAFVEGSLRSIEEETEVFELVNFGGVAQGESDDDLEPDVSDA